MASYATIEEFRTQVDRHKDEDGKPSSDENIQLLLDAASNALDNLCNMPDGFVAVSTASARVYAGSGDLYQRIHPCVAISSVAVKSSPSDTTYTAWATNDWVPIRGLPERPEFNPLALRDPKPYDGLIVSAIGSQGVFTSGQFNSSWPDANDRLSPRAVPTVQVTAKWGYAVACPNAIKEACIAQAARWIKRGESFWADMLANSDMGTLSYVKAMDPDITLMIKLGRFIQPPLG